MDADRVASRADVAEDSVGSLPKLMQQALEAVSNVSEDRYDLLAVELMGHPPPATRLSPEERADLEVVLASVRRGESASDAEVEAMHARHGLWDPLPAEGSSPDRCHPELSCCPQPWCSPCRA